MGHRLWNLIDVWILKLGGPCFLFVYFLEDFPSFFVLILLSSIYYTVVSHKKNIYIYYEYHIIKVLNN